MNKYIGLIILSIAVIFAAGNVRAGTATDSMPVDVTILGECSVSANPLRFGELAGSPDNAAAASSVVVTCTSGLSYEVSFSAGDNALSEERRMFNPTAPAGEEYLSYKLCRDSSCTAQWAIGSGSSDTGSGTGQTVDVFGSINAGQSFTVGTYSDTVTVNINY
ncbi:MAG: spore coat protein U domain-containing protein [Nitrospira sp.]|nr:spore coat protein U domain-containing protein [bacterium]MBL7049715.1 spore coat protein U domain-containing protein [Nitrospira sp.]